MPHSNFPNGINELILRGVPIDLPHPGKVFWVNNSGVLPSEGLAGSDDPSNGVYLRPFGTVDFAIGQCVADRGDIIYVMPGHVEPVGAAAAVVFDVAGVTCIGLGRGTKQPRFDFTLNIGTVDVSANNVAIANMNFHANVTTITVGLDILAGATNCLVSGCTFDVETTATDEFTVTINIGVATDRAVVENSFFDMGLAAAAAAIRMTGASAGTVIRNNSIVGDYSTANIAGITTLSTNILIEDNLLLQGSTGNLNAQPVIQMLTGSTGIIRDNDIICDVATFALQTIADTMSFLNNQRTDDTGQAKVSTTISTSVTVSGDA